MTRSATNLPSCFRRPSKARIKATFPPTPVEGQAKAARCHVTPRGAVSTLPPHVASSHTAAVLPPPGGAAGWSRALCAAALTLGTRHHLRVLSGERGKEGAAGGYVTGVPREQAWAELGTWRPPSVELEGRRRRRRGGWVEKTGGVARCGKCKRGGGKGGEEGG